jgi:hypothetical protein
VGIGKIAREVEQRLKELNHCPAWDEDRNWMASTSSQSMIPRLAKDVSYSDYIITIILV